MKRLSCLYVLLSALALSSCSVQKQIARQAQTAIFSNPDFAPAHVGISLYDPSTHQYLYNYNGDKFFVPASNTKLFTCYAAMKNLGDSLVGLRYIENEKGAVTIEGTGDASFLTPDFRNQPVYDFLAHQKNITLALSNWKDKGLGAGWAWDDYNSDYMAERSALPIYGNVVRFRNSKGFTAVPAVAVRMPETMEGGKFSIRREYGSNDFTAYPSSTRFTTADIPFYTANPALLVKWMKDTLHVPVELTTQSFNRSAAKPVYSQPTDSLLKIMMHRSDNFFAEQSLLMVSNEKLGLMNDVRIIDTLLKTDFAGLPQKPKWVDGSGLSRYNLISPQDFVWVLSQMKEQFAWSRITTILPTGGEGTLSGSYKTQSGRIFAKTGTLSNHVALSGYILTQKGKTLIFSVLVNAHLTSASNIRKGVEKFLVDIIQRY